MIIQESICTHYPSLLVSCIDTIKIHPCLKAVNAKHNQKQTEMDRVNNSQSRRQATDNQFINHLNFVYTR